MADLHACWRQHAVAVWWCIGWIYLVADNGEGAAVMGKVELGGWLTCRIWGSMHLLGTVWKFGRSLMEHLMKHSVEYLMGHSVSGMVVENVVQSTTNV